MTSSENILEFIDGTLDPQAEQGLFEEMSRHPELRSELRQFITIGDAVRSDREAFIPPAHVERSLMAGLGLAPLAFTAAGGGAAAGAAATGWIARLALLKGVWPIVASFVVGGAVAGGGVYVSMKDSTSKGAQAQVQTTPPTAPVQRDSQLSVAAPGTAGTAPSANTGAAVGNTGNSSSGSALAADGQEGRNGVITQSGSGTTNSTALRQLNNSGPAISAAAQDYHAVHSGGANSRSSNRITQPRITSRTPVNTSVDNGSRDQNIVLSAQESRAISHDITIAQTRAISQRTTLAVVTPQAPAGTRISPELAARIGRAEEFPLPEIEQPAARQTVSLELRREFGASAFQDNHARDIPNAPIIEGATAGLYLNPSSNFSYGIEGGFTRYRETLLFAGGDTARIDQQPRTGWLGFAARLTSNEITTGLRGFVQADLGASTAGPTGRAMIGAQYTLFGPLSVSVAGETSAVVYRFNQQQFFTGKYGLTAGLHFGF